MTSRTLHVHLLPALVAPERLAGGTVVVIDVLRASTTIVQALAGGARRVVACGEVDEARRRAAEFPPGEALLGGERGCVLIPGFDLGNSPAEYTPQRVRERTILFTTTNGTRALRHCEHAQRVYVAGFVNAAATVRAIGSDAAIHLLCAGTEGEVAREDTLLAGCLVSRLRDAAEPGSYELNDSALLALAAWRACGGERLNQAQLAAELRLGRGGANLVRNGLEADLPRAAARDSLDLAARYHPQDRRIEAA